MNRIKIKTIVTKHSSNLEISTGESEVKTIMGSRYALENIKYMNKLIVNEMLESAYLEGFNAGVDS